MGHFHVVTESQKKKVLQLDLEGKGDPKLGLGSREYLRVYYSDYFGVFNAKGPKFVNKEETKLEYDEWVRWIEDINPRTRVDAYPLLLVCKELLGKLARNEIQIISSRIDELNSALKKADATTQAQLAELVLQRNEVKVKKENPPVVCVLMHYAADTHGWISRRTYLRIQRRDM